MMLVPVLLGIWLVLSCQHCFAADKPVEPDHSCCPSSQVDKPEPVKYSGNMGGDCEDNCTIKAHQKSDITDRLSLEMQILLGLAPASPINLGYLDISGHKPPRLHLERQIRPSVFESYRILLI